MHDRVKNPFPIPEQCDNCASFDVEFTNNSAVYGRPVGEWPFCYLCKGCGAMVGCHNDTRIPLGRMADKRTRQLRVEAHRHFDPIWRSGALSRTDAYKMLARDLGIPHSKCHISQLNIEQLQYVIKQCKGLEFEQTSKVAKRRKEKKDAKQSKRDERSTRNRFHKGKRAGQNPFVRRAWRSKQDSGTGIEGD